MARKSKQKTSADKSAQKPQSVVKAPETVEQTNTPKTNLNQPAVPCFVRTLFWGIACLLAVIVLYIYVIMIPGITVKPIYVMKTPDVTPPVPALLTPANNTKTIDIPTPIETDPLIKEETVSETTVPPLVEPDESEEIAALRNQINTLKDAQNKTVVDTLALYHLMTNGYPYRAALQKVLASDSQNVFAVRVQQELAGFELTGIPTLTQLQHMYAQDAKMAAYSFYVKKESMTWQENVRAFLKSLVQVRPLHIADTDVTGVKILYKAQDELEAGHIQKALMLLKRLPTEQSVLMADFIRNASARVTLHQMMTSLIREERN